MVKLVVTIHHHSHILDILKILICNFLVYHVLTSFLMIVVV